MSEAKAMTRNTTAREGVFAALRGTLLRPERLQANAVRVAIILLCLWAAFALPGFATHSNAVAIMYASAAVGIAAVGMALITISGNLFMLSMGATAAVSTILFAATLQYGLSAAIAIVIVAGVVVGLVQGIAVAIAKANPIITTIAMSSILMGVGAAWSGGLTVVGQGDASWLAVGTFAFGLPNQILLFAVFTAAVAFVMERMRVGRELRLVGQNPRAAAFAGLRVNRVLILAYVLASASAAFAGALFASQAAQGNLRLGVGLDFDAIAAVLVGGISIRGGQGRILDAGVGAVFLALLSNILLIAGLSLEIQLIVKGMVVVASVIFGALALKFGVRK
ncbi:ABC transporter permease [Paenirhodobacter populi]|nr:ABC transporter permease [Sinirhodobacter populi]